MDCWSWSLPAGKMGACPTAIEDTNSICEGCYAMTGRYCMPNVMNSQYIRFGWTKKLLRENVDDWINIMVGAIQQSVKNGYFRIHDSGDFFSVSYIKAWYEVCVQLPNIKFWAPTRGHRFPNWLPEIERLNQLKNVIVRPSALYFDDPSPVEAKLGKGTSVITDKSFNQEDSICPKTINHSSCDTEKCRSCWIDSDKSVSYLQHGYQVSNKIKNNRNNFVQLNYANI